MSKSKFKNNKKKKIYHFWACDCSEISGEGILGNLFIKNFIKRNISTRIYTVESFKFKNKIINKILKYKYVSPLVGIFFCWFSYFKGRNIGYLNYLPLWNFILFLFLPPNIVLGPVTGGAKFHKEHQYFLRKYFFYIFYKLSEIIIFFRKQKIYFATDLLRKNLMKYTILNSKFNFVFKKIKIKKIKRDKKKICFLIYFKKHKNKNILFPYKLIQVLLKLNFKILVIGDKLNISGVKNLGFVNNKKVIHLLTKTYFTISSNENPYSMFNLECINNNVKIISTEKISEIKYYSNNFLFLDVDKTKNLKKFLNFYKNNN